MAKEYVPIFFDWIENTQDLTQEQKGNLIDAVILYATGGDYESVLQGPEKIAFRFMKGQVDRNTAISEARAKAGSTNKQEQECQQESKAEQTETNENKSKQTETNLPKEKEKEKEKENKKQKREQYADAFDVFWAAYPRHTDKQAAFRAFVKLKPDDALMQVILAGIERQKQSAQWTKDGGQFIPHPATWLNGCRWEDELPKNIPKWANDASHGYTQREYQPGELDAIGDDLIEEARKYRGHTA